MIAESYLQKNQRNNITNNDRKETVYFDKHYEKKENKHHGRHFLQQGSAIFAERQVYTNHRIKQLEKCVQGDAYRKMFNLT